jgi:hypothetical protein
MAEDSGVAHRSAIDFDGGAGSCIIASLTALRQSEHALKNEEDHLTGHRYAGIVATAVFAVALAGCATNNRQAAAQPDDDQTYVTGSRLPGKNGGSAGTKAYPTR